MDDLTESTSMLSISTQQASTTTPDLHSNPANNGIKGTFTISAHHPSPYTMRVKTLAGSLSTSRLARRTQDPSLDDETFTSKSVSFSTVELREYPLILGCNPSVRSGPPLTISWESLSSAIQPLDDFEFGRIPKKRPASFIQLSRSERVRILKDEGFSSEEFRVVEEDLDFIRKSRELSRNDPVSDLQASMRDVKKRRRQTKRKRKGYRTGIGRLFCKIR